MDNNAQIPFPVNIQYIFDKLFERLDQTTADDERLNIQAQILKAVVDATHLTSAYICRWFTKTSQSMVVVESISKQANHLERQSDLDEYYTEDLTSLLGKWITNPNTDGKHINFYDLPRDDPDRKNYLQYGACSLFFVRIKVDDAIWSYLEMWESRYSREFTAQERAIFHYVANKLGQSFAMRS
jgi:hypothetical protein